MAKGSVCKVIIVGNLGDDPETKFTQGGMAVTKARIATSSVRKDRDGNTQERTEWHRVTFFGKLGEIAGEYLRKGAQVYVEGTIRYDKYTGQDGVERYTTDIIADEMQMLGGRPGNRDEGSDRTRNQGGQRQSQSPQRQQSAGDTNRYENDFAMEHSGGADFGDPNRIPF